MNEEIYQRVIGQYAEENANLRLALMEAKLEIEKLKKEVSECSENSEPKE